ncbi:CDP-glycerol--poly(glycerophosphate) glycerophosphotransferase [Shewanella sp. OPT22]|nr:CDP-glycerol--poly(glycerophosphate) glycerophosphotransferase [Shewanella sp. OPT22]
MKVFFDTLNVYYLPQYLPIAQQLKAHNVEVQFVCYRNKNKSLGPQQQELEQCYSLHWLNDDVEAAEYYAQQKPDWIFFGNEFKYLDKVHQVSKTAQLGHGIGPKPSYYHKSKTPMTVRFIEGELRLEKIKQFYPNDTFIQVGFSKLDPIFDGSECGLDIEGLGLDKTKQTILYAPTFNPSSLECFPDDWPSEFEDYNVLIKPHSLTFMREQYKGQRKKLEKWSKFSNVYVAKMTDLNLVPFLKSADILLSEASSTLFEFTALDRPVIVCNFFKLKWSYRGPFKYRFEKRFGKDNVLYKEIGQHINHYKELKQAVTYQLSHRDEYQQQRQQYTVDHVGPIDGQSSQRIVQYLMSHQ